MKGDYQHEIDNQCDHELLIVDDIGSIGQGKTDWRQEVYYALVNNRYRSMQPTVFSTNYTKQEVYDKLGARTHSRLFAAENTVIDMFEYPDLRIKM